MTNKKSFMVGGDRRNNMGNSKNNGRGHKASKSDYMRSARKQRQQENIFFDQLEAQENAQSVRKNKKHKKYNTTEGDADEWE